MCEKTSNTSINGELLIRDKIWFNDAEKCRLRISGFTEEDIEKLKTAKFVDIGLVKNYEVNEKNPLFPYKSTMTIYF